MKTWEMIKELTENPKKEFRLKGSGNIIGIEDTIGHVVWLDTPERCSFRMFKETLQAMKWEEVKKPVTFKEVVKAAKEGKTIGLKYDGFSLEYAKWELDNLLSDMTNSFGSKDLAEIILEGKWYIED